MLRKLMKYEFKATARWFFPLYIAIVLFALISRTLISTQSVENDIIRNLRGILTTISILAYVLLFVGTMVITLVVVVQRFYKSLLGDEGYLMFTLPVKTWQHTISKLLIAMLWNVLSALIGFCSIMLFIPSEEMSEIINELSKVTGVFNASFYILGGLILLINIARTIIEIYAAISLGHIFNKHRIILSFAFYIGINTISQVVSMLILPFMYSPFVKVISEYGISIENSSFTFANMVPQLTTLSVIILVISVILSAGYYIATNYLLKTKLNLE
ncbi:MAG: ABC transporter permease [Ruminiclostridium sp.]|nr:ABC transporter permease [Ruminiclostridium sp.]